MNRKEKLETLPTPFETKNDLSNTFGMFEMEEAATKIITLARKEGTWNFEFSVFDFRDDDYEFIGFIHLLGYGWIVSADNPNDAFKVKPSFIKRVTEGYKKEK